MYNKLFTKILDSSIWLEPTPTRLVWVTFLAAMDQDGFCQFASVPNLAHRARVTVEECNAAVTVLESPDANSSDPDNEGRRIERVPGGWLVLNHAKYRDISTRAKARDDNKLRQRRHREKTRCNASVTHRNGFVTTSEAEAEAGAEADTETEANNRTDRTGRTERPDGSKVSVSERQRQPTGNPMDLSAVDWSDVTATCESLVKLVALRQSGRGRENDRRQWIRYAVLSQTSFSQDWLFGAADQARNSPKPKASKAAIFVQCLKMRSGMTPAEFNELARRIEIPDAIWYSDILGGPNHA